MVIYAINGDDVLYSNMDGGGTPFVDGDSWSVTLGSITADQNGKAGANCTMGNDGIVYMDAGVSMLFNHGAVFKLTMSNGSKLIGIGTVGSHCKIGGDAGQDCNEFATNDGAIVHLEYTDIEYFQNANGWSVSNSWMYLKNCTINGMSTRGFRFFYGYLEMDSCVFDFSCLYCVHCLYSGYFIFKDVEFGTWPGADAWMYTNRQSFVTLIGNNTINQNGGGAVPCDETNDITQATTHAVYVYYPKLDLDEGNNLAGCDVTLNHPSQNANGEIIITDGTGQVDFKFQAFLPFDQGDGSGDVDLYLLREVMTTGDNVVPISDSGEAEAGDNQKFTIGLIKDGYLYNTTTAWSNAGTVSITLSEAGGGRQPRERRHGV
jgi:hypothetical protein